MAMSTCVKCGGHLFGIVEKEPSGSNFKMFFVQCTACGGVVGVTDYYNVPVKIDELSAKLDDLARQLNLRPPRPR